MNVVLNRLIALARQQPERVARALGVGPVDLDPWAPLLPPELVPIAGDGEVLVAVACLEPENPDGELLWVDWGLTENVIESTRAPLVDHLRSALAVSDRPDARWLAGTLPLDEGSASRARGILVDTADGLGARVPDGTWSAKDVGRGAPGAGAIGQARRLAEAGRPGSALVVLRDAFEGVYEDEAAELHRALVPVLRQLGRPGHAARCAEQARRCDAG